MFLKIPINITCHICKKYSEMILMSHAKAVSAEFFFCFVFFLLLFFFHALVMLVSSVL